METRRKKVERKPLKKSTRFDVFRRDTFTCQYCGATPPGAVLEIDHVVALANGGSDDIDNLLTACLECNRGKGVKSLAEVPPSISEKQAIAEEREKQLREYQRLQRKIRKRAEIDLVTVEAAFQEMFPESMFSDSFRVSMRTNFLPRLEAHEMADDMRRACWKTKRAEAALKYFCGICWGKLRERGLHHA